MNSKPQAWFREIHQPSGSSFGLRLKSRLHSEQSAYQKIDIYETTDFGHLMVIDDCIMLTDRDNFIYHEMMSHPVIYSHPCPKRLAIIGGGDCGTLREVLKHKEIESVFQIDIDERVTRLAERYFPQLCESNQDERAELLFEDGIVWMQDVAPGSLDIIIVDSTDPVGPGEVLFSEAFYQSCFRALADDGLLVQQSESPLLHQDLIKGMRERLQSVGFGTLQTLTFPQPVYPAGWWSATLAGKQPGLTDFRQVAEDDIDSLYYSAEIHRAARILPPFLQRYLRE
ncbi:MAG: polyamine aminopropyltransferase [gamma proteobacterium symbiont of Bathyaustriella thionipta]|nr:polyamine aminopropyltransferase [gamma proteobacterium symbiont of Bathyaustriella thionipta]